jgi:DNA repair exonuclease SbcCD ATPase subunit
MKLLELKLKNFKGIKEFNLIINGHNANIFGQNDAGKTSNFDAVTWLLHDKDSHNQSDFGIKTVDQNGNPIHHLEHEVEGKFLVNDREIVLRKVYKEKWTRTRGQATEKFSGHTTEYFIDEVPCKTKREYDTAVSKMMDEKIFKLLTNPLFFNENIEWSERRGIILKVCGDISEEEVINANDSLNDLKLYLNGRSIADLKAVASSKQSKINAELKMIPVRISELQNNLQEISVDEVKLQADIVEGRKQLEEKNKQIMLAENGGTVAQLQIEIKMLDSKIQESLNELNKASNDAKNVIQKKWFAEKEKLNDIGMKIKQAEYEKISIKNKISANEEAAQNLREKFGEISRGEFDVKEQSPNTCSYCGQKLPKELIEHNREVFQKKADEFNSNKAQRLAEINEKGKKLVLDTQEGKEKLQKIEEELKIDNESRNTIMEEIDLLSKTIKEKQEAIITTSPAIEDIKKQQDDLNSKIQNDREAQAEIIKELKEDRDSIQLNVSLLEEQMAAFNQSKKSRERIAELEEKQETISKEYEELSSQIFLTEEFVKRKVDMLQEKINNRFSMARFKMFKDNISNDGIAECCETTYRGVPYKDLNDAAKVNVGLDIIRSLSDYYKFKAPIFIDRAGEVSKLIDMGDTQIIRLVVSEEDKVLRAEIK